MLRIKKNTPVMMLRNVDPAAGLCNGTRLIVTRCEERVIHATIIRCHCPVAMLMNGKR